MPIDTPRSSTTDPNAVTLYRPVGLAELALIWDSGLRRFPPRLPHQPYFYPVTNVEYARQIASTWNVKDAASFLCGFVTSFDVTTKFISHYQPKVVGSKLHTEYWIPAAQMEQFNQALAGRISILEAYFAPEYEGFAPAGGALQKKSAAEQFVELVRLWNFSSIDFNREVSRNRKAIYLNCWFWAQHDFSDAGIRFQDKLLQFERIRNAWELEEIEIPWPSERLGEYLAALSEGDGSSAPYPGRFKNARSRAGGRVDDVASDEAIDLQDEFRESLRQQSAKRPPEVTWLAGILLVYAVYNLVLVILAVTHPEFFRVGEPHRDSRIAFQIAFLGPLRVLGASILGFGLMNLNPSARSRLLFLAALDLVRSVLAVLLGGAASRTFALSNKIAIVVCVAIIACLTTTRARMAFESSPQR